MVIDNVGASTTLKNNCFNPSTAKKWQICDYGGWIYNPDFYPTGEALVQTGASSNSGGYSNSVMDALVLATTQGGVGLNQNLTAAQAQAYCGPDTACVAGATGQNYAQYTNTQVPYMYRPDGTPGPAIQLKTMVGAKAPSPVGAFNPEYITALR